MCEKIRAKFGIPDDWTKDGKLTNWFRSNMGMKDLEGIYLKDFYKRGTLTKEGTNLDSTEMILVFTEHSVMVSTSEWLTLTKVKL